MLASQVPNGMSMCSGIWTKAEITALTAGVQKFQGTTKFLWYTIKNDPKLNKVLANRSAHDMKDKWR